MTESIVELWKRSRKTSDPIIEAWKKHIERKYGMVT